MIVPALLAVLSRFKRVYACREKYIRSIGLLERDSSLDLPVVQAVDKYFLPNCQVSSGCCAHTTVTKLLQNYIVTKRYF